MGETLLKRFIRYAKINTRSDEKSSTIPSTKVQENFLFMLKSELEELGLEDVHITKGWFLTATLPANTTKKYAKVGFISHVDTADFNSIGVNPQIIEKYDGSDIVLNKEKNIVMTVEKFPNLKKYIGKTLITTDGTTLLGSDDKSGIVAILDAIVYLLKHPEIEHGEIRIAFGPDEEIGRGADSFDIKDFNCDYAYTLDGGPLGELEYESFNAAQIEYKIEGVSVHPGTAKDQMINANLIAVELASMFPKNEVPEKTEGYEGFYLLHNMEARIEEANMTYIIRDHDKKKFEARKQFCVDIAKKIEQKYGKVIQYKLFDQYYNMGDLIKNDMRSVNIAKKAMENLKIAVDVKPIRGGTDGSKITYMGLMCPNLFVGGENFHGQYEIACVEDMLKARDTVLEIISLSQE
ncbi:peptidase T [Sneathia sanguinegens]|uniref:peptidase T n=1 Tax=Sneathia sanguinegens TaxID=40543 RepID=UPI00258B710E|nr:peptidase T [Sneathia sanguinegens]MDU4651978.1 peptidase T [Sneathia sanguinegens]MDU7497090.1 peptidase T [Sneathia sanguinegens]